MTKGEEVSIHESVRNEGDFEELYEKSVREIQEGEIIRGRVLSINHDYVIIDVGYKSEGQVSVREFMDEKGNLTVAIGDEVDVFLVKKESKEGLVVLSKARADHVKSWDVITDASKKGGTVSGRVSHRVKGGLIIDINGVSAFLPGSQVDIKPVLNHDILVGKTFKFKVLNVDIKKGNVVVSRKALLEEERTRERERILTTLKEGDVVEGTVKNITDYGVFIDLGGIDGLLHITDISWGRTVHPSQAFSIGDKVKVKVLKFDREKNRVSLGFKQLRPDPWLDIDKRYPVGSRVKGKVVNITDYGAFVELEDGVEGLVHISEMSWQRKIKHPSQKVSLKDEIDVVVLSLDVENKRLSLSVKQLEPNPWDVVIERCPEGSEVKGRITNIADFGVFVEIEEGIDGLVHLSDLSWNKGIEHPSQIFKVGDEVTAVVLNIDRASERLSLGIKQLENDPWKDVEKRYRPGTALAGRVTNIADFGVFVELEEGVEGLIHISEFGRGKGGKRLPKLGQEVGVEVLNIDPEGRKIGLAIKKMKEVQ